MREIRTFFGRLFFPFPPESIAREKTAYPGHLLGSVNS
jgi:hypothetical protein